MLSILALCRRDVCNEPYDCFNFSKLRVAKEESTTGNLLHFDVWFTSEEMIRSFQHLNVKTAHDKTRWSVRTESLIFLYVWLSMKLATLKKGFGKKSLRHRLRKRRITRSFEPKQLAHSFFKKVIKSFLFREMEVNWEVDLQQLKIIPRKHLILKPTNANL